MPSCPFCNAQLSEHDWGCRKVAIANGPFSPKNGQPSRAADHGSIKRGTRPALPAAPEKGGEETVGPRIDQTFRPAASPGGSGREGKNRPGRDQSERWTLPALPGGSGEGGEETGPGRGSIRRWTLPASPGRLEKKGKKTAGPQIDQSSTLPAFPGGSERGRRTVGPRIDQIGPGERPSPAAAEKEGKKTVGPRIDQTLDPAGDLPAAPEKEGKKTVGPRISKTLDAVGGVPRPLPKKEEEERARLIERLHPKASSATGAEPSPLRRPAANGALGEEATGVDDVVRRGGGWTRRRHRGPHSRRAASAPVWSGCPRIRPIPGSGRPDEDGPERADYELLDVLGQGGMGVVSAARQAQSTDRRRQDAAAR